MGLSQHDFRDHKNLKSKALCWPGPCDPETNGATAAELLFETVTVECDFAKGSCGVILMCEKLSGYGSKGLENSIFTVFGDAALRLLNAKYSLQTHSCFAQNCSVGIVEPNEDIAKKEHPGLAEAYCPRDNDYRRVHRKESTAAGSHMRGTLRQARAYG